MVRTTDVDQTRQVFGKLYSNVALEPMVSLPFSYATQVLSFGSVHIATDEWTGGGQLATAAIGDRYILSFPASVNWDSAIPAGSAGNTSSGLEKAPRRPFRAARARQ